MDSARKWHGLASNTSWHSRSNRANDSPQNKYLKIEPSHPRIRAQPNLSEGDFHDRKSAMSGTRAENQCRAWQWVPDSLSCLEDLAKPAFKSLCLSQKPLGALGSIPLTCAPLAAPAGFWSSPPPPLWQPYRCKDKNTRLRTDIQSRGEGCTCVFFSFNFTIVLPNSRNPHLLSLHEGELLQSFRGGTHEHNRQEEWKGRTKTGHKPMCTDLQAKYSNTNGCPHPNPIAEIEPWIPTCIEIYFL